MAPVAGVPLPTPGPHEGSHVREGAASVGGAPLVPPSRKEYGSGAAEVGGLSAEEK